MENECTSHNFSLLAIYLPKIIKIGGKLTKFWQKQFCTVFLRHGVFVYVVFCFLVFGCAIDCLERLDPLYVEWEVKPYTLTHNATNAQIVAYRQQCTCICV